MRPITRVFTRRGIVALSVSAAAALAAVGIATGNGFGANVDVARITAPTLASIAGARPTTVAKRTVSRAASARVADLPNLQHPRVDSWIKRFTTNERGSFATYLSR